MDLFGSGIDVKLKEKKEKKHVLKLEISYRVIIF